MNFGSQFIKKFDFFHKFRLFLTKNYDMIRVLNRPGEKWEQCERLKKEVLNMHEFRVRFSVPEDILNFVNKVEKYDFAMDMQRGRFIVDAKSFLGIMNLGLNNVISLKVYHDDCEQLEQDISQYVAA